MTRAAVCSSCRPLFFVRRARGDAGSMIPGEEIFITDDQTLTHGIMRRIERYDQ